MLLKNYYTNEKLEHIINQNWYDNNYKFFPNHYTTTSS